MHTARALRRPCFLELLQASGCAHDVEMWVQEAVIVSIYPYRAHTAAEAVGGEGRSRRS